MDEETRTTERIWLVVSAPKKGTGIVSGGRRLKLVLLLNRLYAPVPCKDSYRMTYVPVASRASNRLDNVALFQVAVFNFRWKDSIFYSRDSRLREEVQMSIAKKRLHHMKFHLTVWM
jgi:hypothetical protein